MRCVGILQRRTLDAKGGVTFCSEPGLYRVGADSADFDVGSFGGGSCPAPDRSAAEAGIVTNGERFFHGIGFRRWKVRRKLAKPQGLVETGEGMELARECRLAANADARIVVRLKNVQIEGVPGVQPGEPGRTESDGDGGNLVNGLDDFVGVWQKIRQSHFRKGNGMEFADGPFGFVYDVPRIESGMSAEFTEERKKDAFKESFATGGGMKNV